MRTYLTKGNYNEIIALVLMLRKNIASILTQSSPALYIYSQETKA